MVDGNGGYLMGDAVRMGRVLEEIGARWFEEPLPQRGSASALRGACGAPR